MARGVVGYRESGHLDSWESVSGEQSWDALIIGNGLSRNIWKHFDYESLYNVAKDHGFLTDADSKLFDALRTTNFEQVLSALAVSKHIGPVLGRDTCTEDAHSESIKRSLAQAVHAVHVEPGMVPGPTLETIQAELRRRKYVFTTSYDLLPYWSMMHEDRVRSFLDFFWGGSHQDAFDEATHFFTDASTETRMHFLHGALHLVVRSDGSTCKRHSNVAWTLLEQFGRAHRDDEAARPLIVTEANADQKRSSINNNDYLSYCWKTLRRCHRPVIVFGQSLSAQDAHLVDALNEHDRPIAVSIRNTGKGDIARKKGQIKSLLRGSLYFFDSEDYPLGRKELRLNLPWWNPRGWRR